MRRDSYTDASDPKAEMINRIVMAVGFAGASGWVAWMLGWPLILDINDPDFNPMVGLLGLALGVSLWNGFQAILWYLRLRRFGATRMQLDGPVPAPLGRPLVGRLVFDRPIRPKGAFRVVLTCHDVHESGDDTDAKGRDQAFPVWTQERLIPPEAIHGNGIAFRFDLPASVGPKPVGRISSRRNPYFSGGVFITLPGFRRAYTHGRAPVGRFWRLVATAETEGAPYRAEFIVPILD
ncbi:hypothetical protein E7811_11440 [Aliigemmobacter aestuarii]|uniref:Uncharacterized protein n=1 Tax=Aliigemmobacter aestuarii TaxID=1445661 RepID=A0A4V3V080_9RHOB|nr:hypothetical protein [Gemmobacter aestuarii]THD82770.1 hypothetical protein E7811_11440 [Gemmobacter aestuarii]